MWAIDNRTRFSVDRAFARDRDGAEVWVVAVRAAFIVQADGTLVPQAEQPPVCVAPEHLGDPAGSSLRYEMDTIRTKPGTDVILHATAHAPSQEPAPYVDVGFAVGRQRKGLRVYGDRVWTTGVLGLGPGRPEP